MDQIECVVVGAGVVGLAVARSIAAQGIETLALERHSGPGQETSSRNSGVIHSGIYYPTGSLKARMCVRGRTLLYDYASARGVAHSRCGKLIVAQAHQLDALTALHRKAQQNGVHDLTLLSAEQARALEPAVLCAAALHSPSTGIIDVHELMLNFIADLERAGGALVTHSTVERAYAREDGFVLQISSAGEQSELHTRFVINAAGLSACEFLTRLEGYPQHRVPRMFYAKGNYFACHGVRPFRRLVYPMPSHAGLGVHATLDLDGTTRFGPDVEWVEHIDYTVDANRTDKFYEAVREYWPSVPAGALQPAYAGIRPKLVGPSSPPGDFVVEHARDHGLVGLVNLLGIESPGLTSSLALGEEVASLLRAA